MFIYVLSAEVISQSSFKESEDYSEINTSF